MSAIVIIVLIGFDSAVNGKLVIDHGLAKQLKDCNAGVPYVVIAI